MGKFIATAFAVLLFGGFLVANGGIEVVETGERGVKLRFGEVVPEALPEGLYFYNPFTQTIITMDIKTVTDRGHTSSYTKDVQQADVAYSINYHLEAAHVPTVFQTVGTAWRTQLVPQIVEASIKEVIGQWDAVDLIANRNTATTQIQTAITAGLKERFITVENFELNNVSYAAEFEKAVESKVTAIQRAAEAKNRTVQVEEEARQKVIAAEAEAKSMQIRAEALTQNPSLVLYEAVQKWDGSTMPQVIMGMGGATPLLNMDNIMKAVK